jgi:cell fate regulator YaaT (PSP1 superfamily)
MASIAGVRLKRSGPVLYFNTANLEINVNDIVIVETEDGERLARITFTPDQLLLIQTREFTGSVLRLATEEDFNEGSSTLV